MGNRKNVKKVSLPGISKSTLCILRLFTIKPVKSVTQKSGITALVQPHRLSIFVPEVD
jgi:hypothetical protein